MPAIVRLIHVRSVRDIGAPATDDVAAPVAARMCVPRPFADDTIGAATTAAAAAAATAALNPIALSPMIPSTVLEPQKCRARSSHGDRP
ncbi:MAG TPA: hypothetical protein VFW09_15865, partial [Solirubrobacteraceae bacterium]|nr:hypothetical protein [Solirubrobacteraceae bacterium]